MSASEATYWLREYLSLAGVNVDAGQIGSHSCKTTILTWAGRSTTVTFTPTDRRLLGHHLEPSMRSILTYSREAYTTLYGKVYQMFLKIRSGEFDPDRPAVDRIMDPPQDRSQASEDVQGFAEHETVPDSESSAASEVDLSDDLDLVPHASESTDAFAEFPGVPATALFVRGVSGIVHVVSEDDNFLCGRGTSKNYKCLSELFSVSHHFESCSQCSRAFHSA